MIFYPLSWEWKIHWNVRLIDKHVNWKSKIWFPLPCMRLMITFICAKGMSSHSKKKIIKIEWMYYDITQKPL